VKQGAVIFRAEMKPGRNFVFDQPDVSLIRRK